VQSKSLIADGAIIAANDLADPDKNLKDLATASAN